MKLSIKSAIKVNEIESIVISHMCYSASKLWNVCNYERKHYKELDLPTEYPDWYFQKKFHKDDLWYKNLPSQSAQEVCKLLDGSWKSFYSNQKSGKIKNPRPPRFKQESMPITYMQAGLKQDKRQGTMRFTVSRQLRNYLKSEYDIDIQFLYFENSLFKSIDNIKQIKIYPPVKGECKIILIYEIKNIEPLPDNGHYLSIDMGSHNLFTCYDSVTGETFIAGRMLLSILQGFWKEIARIDSQWRSYQASKGVKYPKMSKHCQHLYEKKNNCVKDYLHKCTTWIVNYCVDHSINTLIVGDLKGIREDFDKGDQANQNFHSLPYDKIYGLLAYKCALKGIRFVKQEESWTSQTSPLMPEVNQRNACKENRIHRGLYIDRGKSWNADCVGAYNILRKYLKEPTILPDIQTPYIVKVAV